MGYSARILLDSVNPYGIRLTTMEVTFPRFVLAEWNTHRAFSRNAASSRAIPVEKMIERVMADPAGPVFWGANQKGMQAAEELEMPALNEARIIWLEARDEAVQNARAMMDWGVHKQIVNRLLEPWIWVTVIVSATEYENFFKLRCHKDAQPEIKHIADMMQDLYRNNSPIARQAGKWHLPLTCFDGDDLLTEEDRIKVSVGRCARVSYLTHHGTRDIEADLALHDRLAESGHWSPFEHAAQSTMGSGQSGNFTGWRQYRQMVEGGSR